jgi:FkbM family methyltransferase
MLFYKSVAQLLRHLPSGRNKVRVGRILTKLLLLDKENSVEQIRMKDGSNLLLDARSRTEAGAYWNRENDRDDIDFFKICLSTVQSPICFDVGANIGLIAIPLAHYLNDIGGRVVAFEPVKANFERLVENTKLNKLHAVLSPVEIALGNEEGEIELALETQGGASTGNAMMTNVVDKVQEYTVSTVRITTLDQFVAENGLSHVDFIKLDIEGAELLFLQGGQQFLQRCRPFIYGEFNSAMMPKFGQTFLNVADFIQSWDYQIFAFRARLDLVEITQPKVGLGNVFLSPREKTDNLLNKIAMSRENGHVETFAGR